MKYQTQASIRNNQNQIQLNKIKIHINQNNPEMNQTKVMMKIQLLQTYKIFK